MRSRDETVLTLIGADVLAHEVHGDVVLGDAREARGTPPSATTAPPAPGSDRAVPIGEHSQSVAPAVPAVARLAPELLGGLTIKRRRRGAGGEPSAACPGTAHARAAWR
jgi:hypothetical protein